MSEYIIRDVVPEDAQRLVEIYSYYVEDKLEKRLYRVCVRKK